MGDVEIGRKRQGEGRKGKEKGENGKEKWGGGEKRRDWRKGAREKGKKGVRREKDIRVPRLSSGREGVRLVVLGGEGKVERK